jgi:hypothetical protein
LLVSFACFCTPAPPIPYFTIFPLLREVSQLLTDRAGGDAVPLRFDGVPNERQEIIGNYLFCHGRRPPVCEPVAEPESSAASKQGRAPRRAAHPLGGQLAFVAAMSGPQTDSGEKEAAVPVQVVTVQKATIQRTVTAEAILFPLQQAAITARLSACSWQPALSRFRGNTLQGMLVPFRLTFWDQFWNEISVDAKLSVDRSTTPRPKLPRPKSSLRDPEKIPEISEPVVSQDLSGLATPDVRIPKK